MSQSISRRSPGMFDSRKYCVCSQGAVAAQGVPLEPYIAQPTSRYKSVSAGRWSPTTNTIVGLSAAATKSVSRRII